MLHKYKKWVGILVSLLLIFSVIQPIHAGHRFGLDDGNTKQVQDKEVNSQLPFKKIWEKPLGGKVSSQPIIVDEMKAIFVQAGKDFIKLDYNGNELGRLLGITASELPSGSAPTFAKTQHGDRIYQATRDHRLYAIDPHTLNPYWGVNVYAGNQPNHRFRITASPMVKEINGQTIITLGTGDGDQTTYPNQYTDDGLFAYEDLGNAAAMPFKQRMLGEITGSHVPYDNYALITENVKNAVTKLRYLDLNSFILDEFKQISLQDGVPSSPVLEGDYVYVADRAGRLYKADVNTGNILWTNTDHITNSRVLSSPTVGDEYMFMAVRNYQNYQSAGSGAVVAINKNTGTTAKVIKLESPLKSSVLYWKPETKNGFRENGFIIIHETNGTVQFIEENTWQAIPWLEEGGQLKSKPKLMSITGDEQSPYLVMHDGLLLLVDGQGKMHAYKSFNQNDLEVIETSLMIDGEQPYELTPGQDYVFTATINNHSEENFESVVAYLTLNDNASPFATKEFNINKYQQGQVLSIPFKAPANQGFIKININPSKDNPKNEYSWDNNIASIAIVPPINVKLLDYDTINIKKEDTTFMISSKVQIEKLGDYMPAEPMETIIEYSYLGKTISKAIKLQPSTNIQTFNHTLNITPDEIKNKGSFQVTGHVNKNGEIAETDPTDNRKIAPVLIGSGLDLAVTSLQIPNEIITGQQLQGSAKIKNLSAFTIENIPVHIKANGTIIHTTTISKLTAGQETTITFNWKAPGTPQVATISADVDPLPYKFVDTNRGNNFMQRAVSVVSSEIPACAAAKTSDKWQVTYWVITGYPEIEESGTDYWTDEEGNEHSEDWSYTWTDYSNPIWQPRTVTYNESMTMSVNVNTRQGIPTDLNNPKPDDRHSRGSWEIIPYAQKQAKDPNKITRAGYGFEITVNTNYQNDWETKVPTGYYEGTAAPLGGQKYGPQSVEAQIYDVRGRLVNSISLEKTSGDNNTATWELPFSTYISPIDGTRYTERKIYTDPNDVDGEYRIRIVTDPAGWTGLYDCQTERIEIWGSMYDDVQNVRQRRN
jgi:hypothetical protein